MKKWLKMSKTLILIVFSASMLFAQNKNIYVLANSYKSAYNKDFDYMNHLDTAFDYFEFKGYIKSVLDSSSKYDKCKGSLQVKEITHRAAIIISSSKEPSKNEYISAIAAVNIACDVK